MNALVRPEKSAQTPVAELVETFTHSGCLLIRQALPQAPLQQLLWLARQAYARADALMALGQLPQREAVFYGYGHVPPEACYPLSDPYLYLARLLKPWLPLFQALLQEPLLLHQGSLFRRQFPQGGPSPALPWHQDCVFLEPLHPVLNCWLPLVPCGLRAPSLEILLLNLSTPLHAPRHPGHPPEPGDAYLDYGFTDAEIREHFPEAERWHPTMRPGDLLLFHEFMFHRTGLQPDMDQVRISLEIRLSNPTGTVDYSGLKIPLVHA